MDRAIPDLFRRQDARRVRGSALDASQHGDCFIMGFPSPAADYVETTLTVNSLCNIGANTRVVETSDGYAVVDVSRRPQAGDDH